MTAALRLVTGCGCSTPVVRAPAKYDHIDFKPPRGVARAAERGLELREEFGRGGTAIGVARARDLSNRRTISPRTARRMKAYFDRHEIDRQADGWGDPSDPSAGWIAWLLWGGDPGRAWARKLVRQMNAADEQAKGQDSGPVGWLVTRSTTAPTERLRAARWRGFVEDLQGPTERAFARIVARRLKAHLADIQDRLGEVLRRRGLEQLEARAAGRVVSKRLTEQEIEAIIGATGEAEALRKALGPRLIEAVRRAFLLAAAEVGADLDFDPTLSPADQIIGQLIVNVTQHTRDLAADVIRSGLADGLSVSAMQAELARSPGFGFARALRIARTEATKTVNEGVVYAYNEAAGAGVKVKKEWLSSRDDVVRPAHTALDGQTVDPAAPFVVPPGPEVPGEEVGAAGNAPGAFGLASLVVNCRCTVIPALES